MVNGQEQLDLVGIRLQALMDPICECIENLCECVKSYGNASALPCSAMPFLYRGSVVQTVVCHTASTVFQVPKGEIGTITRITFTERYPGTLYGANFMLMINDNLSPQFPRLDHSAGGLSTPEGTRICLEEQDIVSILIQCSWTPIVYVGIASTVTQMIYPFEMSGYFEEKVIA